LEIGWRFGNVSASQGWFIVIEDFNLVLSHLISPNEGINVDWVPSDISSGVVMHIGLWETGSVKGVLIDEDSWLVAGV